MHIFINKVLPSLKILLPVAHDVMALLLYVKIVLIKYFSIIFHIERFGRVETAFKMLLLLKNILYSH